jgi:hypothetical protein
MELKVRFEEMKNYLLEGMSDKEITMYMSKEGGRGNTGFI